MQEEDSLGNIRADLGEDAVLFLYLTKDLVQKCRRVRRIGNASVEPLTAALIASVENLATRSALFSAGVHALRERSGLSGLLEQKRDIIRDIHAVIGFVGSQRVFSHWQSPAIDQSGTAPVGTEDAKTLAHFNDYTRDQHTIGTEFEKQYRKQYVPVPYTIPVYTYATNSGMAAMATAAFMVMGEAAQDSPILMGESCYFETKQLLLSLFGKRIIPVDLSDPETTREAIATHLPVAVFADTIGNEPAMRIVDIPALIDAMKKSPYDRTFVVADISASSFMRSLVKGLRLPKGLMLMGVESQNKFLQFGFDRVTAGVVWGTGFQAMKLYDYRDHAGTICADTSIATLPTPERQLAERYMTRLARNAGLLVRSFSQSDKAVHRGLVVRYPTGNEFCGAYLMLSWKGQSSRTFDGYIKKVMNIAKRRRVAIVHGTSFGFHTTRIYTVAMHTLYEKPFLRISPGTETEDQMQQLADIFIDAL